MKSRRHKNLAKIAPALRQGARNEEASIRRTFMRMGVVKHCFLGCLAAAGLVLAAIGAEAASNCARVLAALGSHPAAIRGTTHGN